MKRLVNAVLFQTVWFVCLFGGNLWALAVTILYLVLHDRYIMHTRKEWWLLFIFVLLGVLIDGAFFQLNIFAADPDMFWLSGVPPIWLLCLWVSSGTLFAHSLSFLKSRYWLGSLIGLIGPTLSYFAGAKIAGVVIAEPIWLSLLAVALVWSAVIPFGLYLSEKWVLFDTEE